MRKFKLIAVGGTFDVIHLGHRRILCKAFELGDNVIIGLTTDGFVRKMGKTHRVKSYGERFKALREVLEKMGVSHRAEIKPIDDPYGPAAVDPRIEAIVVSYETFHRAVKINRLREARGLKKLEIVQVPMVLADDGKPVSSTRIRLGEIDEEGRLLRRG